MPVEYYQNLIHLVNLETFAMLAAAKDAKKFARSCTIPPNITAFDFGIKYTGDEE